MNEPDNLDTPEWWLQFAREDLLAAERLLADPELPPRQSCFYAQQAAEKAIKAALIRIRVDFPFTHNLETLLELLPPDWDLHNHSRALATLTEFAVTSRYPGDWPEPTEDDARHAVEQARGVVESIERDLAALDETAQSDQ